ncbi:ATP-binding cassette domain-containing protein [Candidatus Methanoperedens nitratireducens]|uniref:ABC transporter ATP-binding protein n=1 Tax=Candidatus Methanoperedens nitratireducens TaxID=1392998 RepID=A0A284VP70_9EURY|nr:ATP-binding cassette domain-containing protein [Candidatus Methanoperedens nitroreducens]SNQ61003.1 putative ABC transporter ATP-binding protein MA_3551 [Candidatus Methanoperedens nitroreducens]
MNAIETIGLEHKYADGTVALSGVDFEVDKGERVAVLGPNGSGKTTLFYHFNGLIRPTAGDIRVFGENIGKENIDTVRRRVGIVFQDADSQLFAPTVFEDIAFGPKNLGFDPQDIKDRVSEILHRFDIEELAKKNPANLSEGQKRRVAIAGVVIMEPDVLVLDEPTSGLDASGVTDTMEILDELNGEGKTIIISTHDTELAASWADRVYILNKGKIFRKGVPRLIFADEKLISEAGLKHPAIVQTFREFHARGISKGEVPLSVLELMDSIDAKLISIRCAVAGFDISAGDEVYLCMKDGMLVAGSVPTGVRGKAVLGGKKGEDIAVKDVTGDLHQLAGSITIVRVPGIVEGGSRAVNIGKIREILEKENAGKIGAMGTSAKVLVNKMGIKCDFEFDVAQSGMLAALRGFNVVIFASGGMAGRVIERVREKKIIRTVLKSFE